VLEAETATFQASGRRIDFPGYFRAYVEGSDDPDAAIEDQELLLPSLKRGDPLKAKQLDPVGHQTQPPARFTEASLVQTLEKEGIGRPSTYATIIGTIQDRGYATKNSNQLVPTFTAMAVSHLMETHFPDLVDTKFTARMEQTLDDIAEGKADSLQYLQGFYKGATGLETQVETKTQSIDPREIVALEITALDARVRIGRFGPYLERAGTEDSQPVRVSLPESLAPAELSDEAALKLFQQKSEGPESLGNDPETGEPIFVLSGRFGPYVQRGDAESNGGKPRRASLMRGMKPETITLQEALGLLALPRLLGLHPETKQAVEANVGRFGPYVKHGDEFRSLTATDDVLNVTLERAVELLSQPKSSRARSAPEPIVELGKHPADGEAITLMKGRFGPYVKHGATNATIPKGVDPGRLTIAQAVELIAQKVAAGPSKKAGSRRRTAATTAAAKPASKTATKATTKTAAKSSAKTTVKPTASKSSAKKPTKTPATKPTTKPATKSTTKKSTA
jgi:DNA topoisomerase-1